MSDQSSVQTRARLQAHYASDDLDARGYDRHSPEAIGYLLGCVESAFEAGYRQGKADGQKESSDEG